MEERGNDEPSLPNNIKYLQSWATCLVSKGQEWWVQTMTNSSLHRTIDCGINEAIVEMVEPHDWEPWRWVQYTMWHVVWRKVKYPLTKIHGTQGLNPSPVASLFQNLLLGTFCCEKLPVLQKIISQIYQFCFLVITTLQIFLLSQASHRIKWIWY